MDEIRKKFEEFTKEVEIKRKIESAWERHKKFLELYPFREHPKRIDNLTPDNIYNPGGEYFFYWIEHGLKELGNIGVGSAKVWENAKNNLEKLKKLLKLIVDDSLTVAEKIDARWESISGFGGGKQIAKKILFCYYPDKIIPIFKIEDMEFFCEKLDIEFRSYVKEKLGTEYEKLSEGKKFEMLNELLLKFKNEKDWLRNVDNSYFVRFLYETFEPPREEVYTYDEVEIPDRIIETLLKKFKEGKLSLEKIKMIIKEIGKRKENNAYDEFTLELLKRIGFNNIPYYENEIIFLFGKFHKELGFPEIEEIHPNKYPDVRARDVNGNEKTIEIEVYASEFIDHGHDPEKCDFIVCWRNDLEKEELKKLPKVISIEEFILEKFIQ